MDTPFDRIQAGWATGNHLALHQEVEQLAAQGHSRTVLEVALAALLREARSTGADDETEEIINGVWDQPTGWCPESSCIRMPQVDENGTGDNAVTNGQITPGRLWNPRQLA